MQKSNTSIFSRASRRLARWLSNQLYWPSKLRSKIFLFFISLTALPLLIFAIFAIQLGTSYFYLERAYHDRDEVGRISRFIDKYFVNQFNAIQSETEKWTPADVFPGSLWQRRSTDLLLHFPDIQALAFSRNDGRIFHARSRMPGFKFPQSWRQLFLLAPGQPPAENPFFKFGRPVHAAEIKQVVVPAMVSLPPNDPGRGNCELVLYLGLDNLRQNLFHRISGIWTLPALTELTLLDAEGKVLLHPRFGIASDWYQRHISNEEYNALITARPFPGRSPRIFTAQNDLGKKIMRISARCPNLGWIVVLETSLELPQKSVDRLRLQLSVFFLIALFFSLLGGIWFISRLVGPIEELEAGIKLLGSGLLAEPLPVRSKDEVGRLTQTFNQMSQTLIQRNEEIRIKTRELSFFNTITRIINQSIDLHVILDNSLQKILQLLHATYGMVYVYLPALKKLSLISHFGLFDSAAEIKSLGDTPPAPLVWKSYASGESLLIRDVPHHAEAVKVMPGKAVQDLMLIPLKSKNQMLGVLSVGNRRRHAFHYRDLDLLERIGDEIGVAIENSMLYAQLQLKIRELEEANRDLKELDRFKNQFVSNVSHELRTPMTSIKSYVDLFLDDKIGPLDAMQKEKLTIVQRNVGNLLTLINDLLSLSRVKDDKTLVTQMEVVLLPELIEQVIADTIEMAKAKGLELRREGGSAPIMVRVNRQRLRQVLQNLVFNAVKFTERGVITLAWERCLEEQAPQPAANGSPPAAPVQIEKVRISVSDTGIGIPQEEIGKIFRRFYQVDSSSTRKYVGTGLGLAIVKEILESHHSEIHVESQVGQGSRFWFTLPIIESNPLGA